MWSPLAFLEGSTMYNLQDDSGRLAELANRSEPEALRDEIAIARWITEKSAQTGNFGLALAGVNALAKLSTAEQAYRVRSSQNLDRATVLGFGRAVADLLSDEVERLPLSEGQKAAFTDHFLSQFAEILMATANGQRKQAQPLLLEREP